MDWKADLYRKIPKVDTVMESDAMRTLTGLFGREAVLLALREELGALRALASAAGEEERKAFEKSLSELSGRIETRVRNMFTPAIRRVINGTGTVLHTNLGRAPLPEDIASLLVRTVSGYASIEYDLENGVRGERTARIEKLLTVLTGAESAAVVNNNAAAVLLVLRTLAKDGEVIVSRGELVEIGGKFRIPDVIEESGSHIKEVGTTNKTHPEDYSAALTDETKAILKVHTSNYRIHGFTGSVSVPELKKIAAERNIPVIEDLGSGVLFDLEKLGLEHEPTVGEAVRSGADVICFSGDKLLGGPQAGIIVGRKELIDKIKKQPLARAVRVDKFTAAALELILTEYLNPAQVPARIPVLRMLGETPESSKKRAEKLSEMLKGACRGISVEVRETSSRAGGGALPEEEIPGHAVVIKPLVISTAELSRRMLRMPVPVIGRIEEDAVWLDVRTIADDEFGLIAEMFCGVPG